MAEGTRKKVKDLTVNIEQCPSKKVRELNENRSKTSYTWVGHSTFFIQMKWDQYPNGPSLGQADGTRKKGNGTGPLVSRIARN